jgi:hypothetical protein
LQNSFLKKLLLNNMKSDEIASRFSIRVFFSTPRLERKSQHGGRGRASKHVTRKQKRTAALMDAEACGVSSVEE